MKLKGGLLVIDGKLLMIPGPTMVPERALQEGSKQVLFHRSTEFGKLFAEVNEGLQYVFQTQNPVLTFPAVGTGGLEATVANLFSPGDTILSVTTGVFGERFATIAKNFGLNVYKLDFPWGQAIEPDMIKKQLEQHSEIKAVFVTHNETSTGVVNDLVAIGKILRQFNVLYVVDAVSSLGGIDLQTDVWDIDVVITASQKALMSPPGLTFISVGPRAWEAVEKAKLPKYYWDFINARKYLEKKLPQNPYTPAVTLIASLNEALKMMREEGMDVIFNRHQRLAHAVRKGVEGMGLNLFAASNCYSNTVTAITVPEGIDGDAVRKIMSEQYNVVVAGGQASLKGKIIRMGHMGYVNEDNVLTALQALAAALQDVGYKGHVEDGLTKAKEILG